MTTYIPVYTLHEMRQMVAPEEMPQQPVIICTGCAHEIPAPRGAARVQCRDCGKRMQVVSISPAQQATRAT
jgi:LSD1 subclass zinc finger protein